jgi:adenylate cyclase
VLSADWDDRISRRHVELTWTAGRLSVRRLEAARNPIFVGGKEQTQFTLEPGEHFVIGQTSFTLLEESVNVSLVDPRPDRQQSFSPEYLQQVHFRNARARIEALGRLPEVISGATSQEEMFVRLTGLLMAGIPTADAVALVRVPPTNVQAAETDPPAVDVMHWDRRRLSATPFQPSERLIRDSIAEGKSVVNAWDRGGESAFTAAENVDWAFCTPISGSACRGWGIYVAGRYTTQGDDSTPTTDPTDLRDDLKFTEVAAATLRSLQELRVLQRNQAVLGQFLSPVVHDAVNADEDPEQLLMPRETEVSILFCDLRGFSRESEKAADNLLGLLDRVSTALGVTTHHIREHGGVLGDIQGDAVMGFWGWPLAKPDSIDQACGAALAIRNELASAANRAGDPLAGFRLGIGMATGNAVAGKIGTAEQMKLTVFGPVVNLASRLEGMTKILRAPILLDERTAAHVRKSISPHIARVRRLAVVCPMGMSQPVEVSELLPPVSDDGLLTDQNVADYESALDAFQEGRWSEAFELLHRVPADDRAKDFLTVHIVQHNRTAPPDWYGVITLDSK